ncbi:hypothetical protein DYB36_010409, partial [Aphanomyces astaci]
SNSSIVDTVTSSTRPSSSSPPPLSAKERQAQVLAKMKAQQQSFLINQVDVPPDKLPLLFNSTASDDDEAVDHVTVVPSSVTLDDQPDVCSLCHDHVTDQVDGLHYMGCVTPSNIAMLAQPPFSSTNIQCHIRLCGHVVHRPCIWAYVASLYSSNDERLLSRDDAEFLCPVCRRLCNTLVPVALDHHTSAPSADCLLQGAAIRYCEDDVEMDSAPDKLVETALDSLANQVHEYTCQPHTTQQTLTELFLHTLFLTHVLLLLGHGRCCIWGSVYLDRNGEEDAHFRRGKTLYLNQERVAALTRLVVLHGFTENTAILNNTSRRDGSRY